MKNKLLSKLLSKLLRAVNIIMIFFLLFNLSSCGLFRKSIKNKLDQLNKYPGVNAKNNKIASEPPIVLLNKYKLLHFVDSNNNSVAIAIAVSGGGYRASNFALGVMSGLEEIKIKKTNKNLLQQVNYFSSVSGGGFAVGFYLSQYSKYLHELNIDGKLVKDKFSLRKAISEDINNKNLINQDLQQKFINFKSNNKSAFPVDLQSGILSRGDKLPPLTLGNIFINKSSRVKPSLPLWVVNSTVFQNFSIFPFSPGVLSDYKVSGYYWNKNLKLINNYNNFPMAFAVASSASFPVVLPSMTLASSACDKKCYLQLYDGGLTDNLGVLSALSLLSQDKSHTKILIVIDSVQVKDQAYSKNQTGPGIVKLLWSSLNSSPNHMHIAVEGFMKRGFREFLCSSSSGVFLTYISLKDYKNLKEVPTSLHLTPENQKYLLKAGNELVKENADIIKITEFLNGNNKLGRCDKHK